MNYVIVLLEKWDAEFIIKRFLSYESTKFTMRILATFTIKDSAYENYLNKFTLLSFDYLGEDNKELSLVTYKRYDDDFIKKHLCDECHLRKSVLVFHDNYNGLEPIHTCYCTECLEQKNTKDTNLFNLSFILNNLITKNNQKILDYVFKDFSDLNNKFYGHTIQRASIGGKHYYYLNINDIFSTYWFNKSANNFISYQLNDNLDLYICNYLIFINYISDTDSKKFFINKLLNIIPSDKIEYKKDFIKDLSVSLLEDILVDKNNEKDFKDITIQRSRYKNGLFGQVGSSYKNANVKLVRIEKDNKDFFKGRYKYLYLLYFGYYNLFWNTNKSIENGNYVCNFKVIKHIIYHDYAYTFISDCKMKMKMG